MLAPTLTRAVAASAALGTALAVAVLPAGAEQRTITVTLLGGESITVTANIPPGTALDKVRLPDITTPIVAISSTPSPAPAPAAEPPASAAPRDRAPRHRRRARTRHPRVARAVPSAHKKPRAPLRPPAPSNPTFSFALPGPAPIGVPNFFIEKFRVPPFLLPIYQAAGIEYGVRWEVLAAINEIETDYGRNLNVSTAGAVGWMQFMPSTWKRYGTDANNDGARDPYNPVDAIFAAARYLRAAGAESDLARALFAYNHAGWYVDSVLLRAKLLGAMPADLVGALTGLTQGRFPVRAAARYADEHRPGIEIFARPRSAVVAAQDSKIVGRGRSRRLGRFLRLRDAYGNTYTYAGLRPRRLGRQVAAGSVIGRVGAAGHVLFEIRPAGRGAPRIDPKPILDGWKLLESTAIYRAVGRNALLGDNPTIGQVLMMSKAQLRRRVLSDPRIELYDCGRRDIEAGVIDRRVLASLEFLSASGLKPAVSSLRCGHGYYTKGGSVSDHSFGSAVDIAKINGIPILGHQGPGSVAEMAVQRLLTLQGVMRPSQIISLMTFQGADNAFAMSDHADHIHVGWRPLYDSGTRLGRRLDAVLKPGQWVKLIDRIGSIANPTVLRR